VVLESVGAATLVINMYAKMDRCSRLENYRSYLMSTKYRLEHNLLRLFDFTSLAISLVFVGFVIIVTNRL